MTSALRSYPVRGPYWRPGFNALSEPWAALAETNTGHLVSLQGRNSGAALAVVKHWEALAALGQMLDMRVIVGAALVNPAGEVREGWGSIPLPGGPARWAPITRLREPMQCTQCHRQRWVGCWVDLTGQGCAECMPAREADDPRVWPLDPPEPSTGAVTVARIAAAASSRMRRPPRGKPFTTPRSTRDVV